MRVISGASRGKKLFSIEGNNTRPTLDRVKEALFNIIQSNIKETFVLDLFAGTGGLGIEALSRGAKKAIFCDNSKEAINVINKNVEGTKNQDKAVIINKDFNELLIDLANKKLKFDLIFLDPPYKTDYVITALQKIIMSNLLSDNGIIIVETDDPKKEEEILKIKNIKIFDKRKYGSVWLIFIRKG